MFDFLRGRTNRATYWMTVAALVVVYTIIALLAPSPPRVQEVVLAFLCIPRLHDIGRSGWWVAVGVVVEIVCAVLALALLPQPVSALGLAAINLAILVALVILGAIPGERVANRFGEPPAPGVQWKASKRRA